MDSRLYPQGKGMIKSRYVSGVLIFYHPTTAAELFRIDPAVTGGYIIPGASINLRTRLTVAAINAGATTVFSARAGFKYRMLSATAIAVGGAVGATTTVDILATQATASAKLVAFAQASLTQSTVLVSGGAGAAVLADGASYIQNDVNTAIQISKTGASLTVATSVDFLLSFVLEP